LYYVQKGSVEVFNVIHNTKIVFAMIGEGSFFGEIGFFDGVSRIRNIRATEDSVILLFDQGALGIIQQEDPVFHGKFLTFICESICAKFRRILEEREPLMAYAASLSTGQRSFQESKPLPERFFQTQEWKLINKVVEDFKANFFDLAYRLQMDSNPTIPEALEYKCLETLNGFNDRLESLGQQIGEDRFQEYVWGYAFKEIFPYFMRSRFAERAYFKPKGYAGDFLMMELIYGNKPDGDGKLGVLVDRWCLDTTAAKAVRGRRKVLREQLESLCRQKLGGVGPVRIMNLACGSNRELFDFLSRWNHTGEIEALCLDADPDALQYTDHHVNCFPHEASIRLMNENVVKWALGRVRHDVGLQDIIYVIGLADYLDRRLLLALINRCYEHLKPGGYLIIGNFSPNNPNRIFMDHILQWTLIYRNERELGGIFADSLFGNNIWFLQEEHKVNLFVLALKPVTDGET
jgi:SAM-dependent methyltransferase